MDGELVVRQAEPRDAGAYARHLARHLAESGVGGAPHFAPSALVVHDEVREASRDRWSRRLDSPGWGRMWLALANDKVVGHAELRGGRLLAELHRASVSMGLERPYVGRGHGGRLLDAALAFARGQEGLAYVDLCVFEHNHPARRLYASRGFVEVGRRPDAFRLADGTKVTDVAMAVGLRAR